MHMSIFFCTFAAAKVCASTNGQQMQIRIDDDIKRGTAEEIERLLPLVSAQRREQALRFKHPFGQYCCLRSWIMLKELMGERLAVNGEWEYNEYGKPFLKEKGEGLKEKSAQYFSISHCHEAIAVAVDDQPIGIDIESIRPAKEELVAQTMNEEEFQLWSALPTATDKDRFFTRLWTQKEAVLKCLGTGIQSFEQLKNVLSEQPAISVQTFEKEKYICSIASKTMEI